jgi:hypothetical protein
MHTLAHCHSMHSVSPIVLVLSPATLSSAGWKHAAQHSSLPRRRTVSLLGSVADVHGCGATRRCRYGVRSAVAMSPNTAGVGLLLAGIPLTMASLFLVDTLPTVHLRRMLVSSFADINHCLTGGWMVGRAGQRNVSRTVGRWFDQLRRRSGGGSGASPGRTPNGSGDASTANRSAIGRKQYVL